MELFLITLLVADYDEAIAYYCSLLGFSLIEDTRLENGKRWVVISPALGADAAGKGRQQRSGGTQILLAKTSTIEQRAVSGNQHGGRVGFFLYTDNFHETYERLKEQGVQFCESPREEAYGDVVIFKDLYGNKWDLMSRAA